jgi:AmmeMemoRadiSam system protein B
MPVPRLRPLDVTPFEDGGRQFFHLRDPEGVSPSVTLQGPAMFIVIGLDGRNEITDLQAEFARRFGGVFVSSEDIQNIISELDRHGLLLTERYRQRRREMEQQFRTAPTRPSALAGGAYPAEPEALGRALDGYFSHADGPGPIDGASGGGPLAGAIAPHIDFARGGVCYAHAYKPIAERARHAETFVILGVAHAAPPAPFTVLDKPFETPLGTAPVDAAVVEALRARAPAWAFEHVMCHRTEHSIEFQVVFLQYVRRELPFKIVPILCGSFETACEGAGPATASSISAFLEALREALAPLGPKAFILGGADLAHIGPRFGDPEPLTSEHIARMEREDAASLEAIRRGDAEEFWTSVMSDGNRRKVCGLGSIYATLRLLSPRRGEVLRYGHAPDPAGGEVSFVSAVFPG